MMPSVANSNRLASVKIGGKSVADFRYNALGQRTHKISAQGITTFLYGPDGQLLGEQLLSPQGVKLSGQFHIWLDRLPIASIHVTFNPQGGIAKRTLHYLHSDHLDTPRQATDQNRKTLWRWKSDAFGVGEAVGSATINLRFPGQYFDQETRLHYNYFRDYDPQTGRYVESDPIGLDGGLNTYGYVEGNPINLSDPLGLAPGDIFSSEAEALADARAYKEAVNSSVNSWLWGIRVYGFRIFQASECMWTYDVVTPVLGIAPPTGPRGPWKINKPGVSGKAGAKDKPSWASGEKPYQGESGKDFAKRLMDQKYGQGNWKEGPGSEYNQIRKWGDRSFMDPK